MDLEFEPTGDGAAQPRDMSDDSENSDSDDVLQVVNGLFDDGPPASDGEGGAPADEDQKRPGSDPVASLFRDSARPATPDIGDAPSDNELSQWQADDRTSLFDEQVRDPPARAPGPPPPPAPIGSILEPLPTRESEAIKLRESELQLMVSEPPEMAPTDLAKTQLGVGGLEPLGNPLAKTQLGVGGDDPMAKTQLGVGNPAASADPMAQTQIGSGPEPVAMPEAYDEGLEDEADEDDLVPDGLAPPSGPRGIVPVLPPVAEVVAKPAKAARKGKRSKQAKAKKDTPAGDKPRASTRRRSKVNMKVPALMVLALVLGGGVVGVVLRVVELPPPMAEALGLKNIESDRAVSGKAGAPPAVETPAAKRAPTEQEEAAAAKPAVGPGVEKTQAPEAAAPEPKPKPAEPVAADSPRRMFVLARSKLQDDDAEGAKVVLDRLLAKAPRDHHAKELMAKVMMDLGQASEAVKHAAAIVKRRPKRASYRLVYGDALLMAGDKAGAEAQWRKALAISPGNKKAKGRLGN